MTRLVQHLTYSGPSISRELPPATSPHGGGQPSMPQGMARADCPISPEEEYTTLRGDDLKITFRNDKAFVSHRMLTWRGPDSAITVLWEADTKQRFKISGINLATDGPAYFNMLNVPQDFVFYQRHPELLEPYRVEETEARWGVHGLFPQPGCWQIKVEGPERVWNAVVWLQP